MRKEVVLINKPEDIISYIQKEGLEDYKTIYVGKTGNINRRLREYYNGISGKSSTTPALVRSIVREINDILPFDNIVRTYINTGIFLIIESKEPKEMEEGLIRLLNPKLNRRIGDERKGKFVYVFLHKHEPSEFLDIYFPELKKMKELILKRCFELNLEALPYDKEQETVNLHSAQIVNSF